jgi:hypothetical protein
VRFVHARIARQDSTLFVPRRQNANVHDTAINLSNYPVFTIQIGSNPFDMFS